MNNFCPPSPPHGEVCGFLQVYFSLLPLNPPLLPLLMVVQPLPCSFAQVVQWNGVTEEKTQGRIPSSGFPLALCTTCSHSLLSAGLSLHHCVTCGIFPTGGKGQVLWPSNSKELENSSNTSFEGNPLPLIGVRGKCHNEGRIIGVNLSFPFFLFHNLQMGNRLRLQKLLHSLHVVQR